VSQHFLLLLAAVAVTVRFQFVFGACAACYATSNMTTRATIHFMSFCCCCCFFFSSLSTFIRFSCFAAAGSKEKVAHNFAAIKSIRREQKKALASREKLSCLSCTNESFRKTSSWFNVRSC